MFKVRIYPMKTRGCCCPVLQTHTEDPRLLQTHTEEHTHKLPLTLIFPLHRAPRSFSLPQHWAVNSTLTSTLDKHIITPNPEHILNLF